MHRGRLRPGHDRGRLEARHYHLSSRALSPAAYLEAARAHWAVENSLRWVLDVTFGEDRARNRKGNGPEISIRRKRKRSG